MKLGSRTSEINLKSEVRQSEGRLYEYTLTVNRSPYTASYRLPLYSISVNLTDRDGIKSQRSAENAFVDPERALAFFDRLVENLATPIDLPYILEDEFN